MVLSTFYVRKRDRWLWIVLLLITVGAILLIDSISRVGRKTVLVLIVSVFWMVVAFITTPAIISRSRFTARVYRTS